MSATTTKTEVPEKVQSEMNSWRKGMAGPPESYIAFHETLARESLKAMPVTVHRIYMDDDGWFDGMTFIHAVVETKDKEIVKIKWCDSQHWKKQHSSGGWGSFRL